MNVENFTKKINKGEGVILDVRTPEEYADRHIKKVINIDWKNTDKLQAKAAQLQKTKPVFV